MNTENPNTPNFTRRQWLQVVSAAAALGIIDPTSAKRFVSAAQENKDITHVPEKLEDLLAMSDAQKTLLAVATVAGSDAVGYYALKDGKYTLQQHIDVYPTQKTEFQDSIAFNEHTHDSDAAVRASEHYHLAVRDKDNVVQGIIVLHAPTGHFSHVQTEAEATRADNMNEPPATRRAKIAMGGHILEKQKATLLPEWQKRVTGEKNSLQDQQAYFKMLRDDFLHIIGETSSQAEHVTGVSDLMMVAVDKVINTPEKKIIGEAQQSMLKDLTILHDVGKLQTSVPFLVKQWRADATEIGKSRGQYFMGQNHNHPLFTYLALDAHSHAALTTAAHHHGVLRYTETEMQKGMGDGYQEFRILKDNVPFDELSSLSKFMRICDVTEAMTGRANKPVAAAIKEMAQRAGYDAESKSFKPVTHDCNSFEPEYLCMMIANQFFQSYGKMRTEQKEGWKDPNGASKYDEKAVNAISEEVLAAFQWKERKSEIETRLRGNIEKDALVAPAMEKAGRQ